MNRKNRRVTNKILRARRNVLFDPGRISRVAEKLGMNARCARCRQIKPVPIDSPVRTLGQDIPFICEDCHEYLDEQGD